jgi:hypothetical protein
MVFETTPIVRYSNLDCCRICNNMAVPLVCNHSTWSSHMGTGIWYPGKTLDSSDEVAVDLQATLHSMNITTLTLHRLASDRPVVRPWLAKTAQCTARHFFSVPCHIYRFRADVTVLSPLSAMTHETTLQRRKDFDDIWMYKKLVGWTNSCLIPSNVTPALHTLLISVY